MNKFTISNLKVLNGVPLFSIPDVSKIEMDRYQVRIGYARYKFRHALATPIPNEGVTSEQSRYGCPRVAGACLTIWAMRMSWQRLLLEAAS